MPQFDVFLSHCSVDKPWVIKLKDDLLRYGVSVWLDKDEIRPGDLWVKVLEEGLLNSRAVALVVSPEAIDSGWVEEEYYRALTLAKNKQTPLQIIPVILRDAELPGFLEGRNWVDFREESAYSQGVWKLVWGITGDKPARFLEAIPPPAAVAPAPPLAAPPPPFFISARIIALIAAIIPLVLLAVLLTSQATPPPASQPTPASPAQATPWLSSNQAADLFFTAKMILLALSLAITPTIAYHVTKKWGRVARIALESTAVLLIFIVFAIWLVGFEALGVWVIYAIGLILLLEIGSHAVERYQIVTLERVSKEERLNAHLTRNLKDEAKAIEEMFHSERALYAPIPFGLLLGTVAGLAFGYSKPDVVNLSLRLVLWTVSIALILFLIVAFKRMIKPIISTFQSVASPEISIENTEKREGIFKRLGGKAFRLLLPPPESQARDQKQEYLDAAYVVTDLRKVYLYDAVHNVALLVACVAVAISLRGISINATWVIAGLIGLSILFNQLPFVYGQWSLHERILEHYEGTERADLAEELGKYAPLFPKSNLWAALFTYGAGGLAYYFLDQLVKNAFK
jgi:hypothetical protein